MDSTHDRDHLFPLVREPASRWEKSGLTPEQERTFDRAVRVVAAVFAVAWVYALFTADFEDLVDVRESVATFSTRITANPLAPTAPPEPVFAVDELVRAVADELDVYRGLSGEVNIVIQEPGDTSIVAAVADTLPPGAEVELQPAPGEEPASPGVWNLVLRVRDAVRPVSDVSVVSLVPLSERRGGRIGRYLIGEWPFEDGAPPRDIYRTPKGVIRVTPQNRNLQVSEHFVLGDFLTKGQAGVWPKYVVLDPRLLDKLELTIQELERAGHPVEDVFVVSGFRTPVYNQAGGNPAGRGALSRHMYGDAADIAIDNDGNGRMDDLTGDGRVTVADARVVAAAAERVERKYPSLVGGIGVYRPTGGHSGMVHIDTRGFRARW